MFIREKNGRCCIVLAYVDDLIISGDEEESISKVKIHLEKVFTIKNLGGLRCFLGIEVARRNKWTMLNQRKYAINIVRDAGMKGCNATNFSFLKGVKISEKHGEMLENAESYRRLIEKLLYLNLQDHIYLILYRNLVNI